jgi:hypothetical protein
VAENAQRGWLERLGLKTDRADPEEWVIVASSRQDTESVSQYAERTVDILAEASIQAEAKPYVRPDDSTLRGITGDDGSTAQSRLRVAVVVRRRDQVRAEEILRQRPKAEPISDEELARLAEEAGPHPLD